MATLHHVITVLPDCNHDQCYNVTVDTIASHNHVRTLEPNSTMTKCYNVNACMSPGSEICCKLTTSFVPVSGFGCCFRTPIGVCVFSQRRHTGQCSEDDQHKRRGQQAWQNRSRRRESTAQVFPSHVVTSSHLAQCTALGARDKWHQCPQAACLSPRRSSPVAQDVLTDQPLASHHQCSSRRNNNGSCWASPTTPADREPGAQINDI